MRAVDEQILRTSKEIVVKFIEVGRVTPNNFREIFQTIHDAVATSVRGDFDGDPPLPPDTKG